MTNYGVGKAHGSFKQAFLATHRLPLCVGEVHTLPTTVLGNHDVDTHWLQPLSPSKNARSSQDTPLIQEWPQQTKPKKGRFMNFSQGHSGTKVQCESCLFSKGKKSEFTKMGKVHELFVAALSLVWFAGATPD